MIFEKFPSKLLYQFAWGNLEMQTKTIHTISKLLTLLHAWASFCCCKVYRIRPQTLTRLFFLAWIFLVEFSPFMQSDKIYLMFFWKMTRTFHANKFDGGTWVNFLKDAMAVHMQMENTWSVLLFPNSKFRIIKVPFFWYKQKWLVMCKMIPGEF